MSKKKNRKKGNNRQALARAQKSIGNKATKSDVRKLERKGFSSRVIRRAVSKAPAAGKQAQARVQNRHTSSSRPSGGRAQQAQSPPQRRQALARAQSIIGNKATKSDVRKLERKGVSSNVIRRAVSKAPNAGKAATARVDSRHAAGSGQPKNVHTAGGSKVTWDPKKGRVHNVRPDIRFAKGEYKTGAPLTKDSRKEVNRMVRQGYSFEAPQKGKFNTVNVRVGMKGGKEERGTGDGRSTIKRAPNSWDSITLYQSVKQKTNGRGRGEGRGEGRSGGSSGGNSRGSSGGSSGSASPASNVRGGGTIYEPYSGAPKDPPMNSRRPGDTGPPSLGNRPVYERGTLGAEGSGIKTHWSDTPERLADYGNRLDIYNRENIDWLGRQGEQQKASSAAELMQLAGAMPRQEEERNPYKDVLDFIKRAGA